MSHMYEDGLGKNGANHLALTPLSFLKRAAHVYPQKTAIIHGELHRSYADYYARCVRLASALAAKGIAKGDTVAVMWKRGTRVMTGDMQLLEKPKK